MKFQNSLQNWKVSVIDLAIKLFPIEPQNRTKINNITSFALYLLEYLIILTIVTIPNEHLIQIEPTWTMILVFQILRMAFNLLYIITKNKIFFCLKACTLFANCLFPPEHYSLSFLPMIIFDIVSCLIWVLTLQQKNLHFDSRLLLKNGLFKKLICTQFVIIWISIRFYFDFSILIYFLFCIALFVLDFTDHLYYRKFKKMLVTLDLCCIFSAILPTLYQCLFQQLKFSQHALLIVIYLITSLSYSYISPHNYDTLYTIDPYARKFEQYQILQYFITFMQMIEVQSVEEKINYIVHHVRRCHQVNCLLKYHHFRSKQKDNYQHKQILRLFIKQQLINLAKKYFILEDLLIYNYYDRNQIYNKYLETDSFFHRREQQRFFQYLKQSKNSLLIKQQQNRKQTQIESPQNTIQISIVPQIQQFVNNSLIFWRELSEYNVDCTKLLKTGTEIIRICNDIEDILKSGVDLVQKSRAIANEYKKYLLGQKQNHHQYKFKIEHNLSGFVQTVPTIVVSAEKQTFLGVVDVNTAAIKATGYTKSQLTKFTIDQFWDKQIRQEHIKLAHKRANYIAYMSQPLKTYAFLKNKFGYIVLTDAKVYYLNDLTGKKWCVVMDPYLENQAALVFNFRRQLLGVTEQCVAKGIDKPLEGQIINLDIFSQCLASKKSIKIKGKQLFEQNTFQFPCKPQESVYLKFQSQIYFNGKPTYYVMTINKRKQILNSSSEHNRYSQSSMLSRRSSGISKNSFMTTLANGVKMNSDERDLSNFEFSYDWKSRQYKGKKIQPQKHEQTVQKHQNQQDQIHMTEHESQIQFVKQDTEIIQMRLWQGKLDFIENMQSVNVNFESLPQFSIDGIDLTPQRIKQQFSARMSKVPKNLIYVRVFFGALLVLIVAIGMFVEIGGMINESKLSMQLQANKLIFEQLDSLLSLSTTLVAQKYNSNLNTQQILYAETMQIEQMYKDMQTKTDQFSSVIDDYSTKSYNLKKSDDIYRLLIKEYINNQNASLYSVANHFLTQIYAGWEVILFQLNQKTNMQHIDMYYAIFLCFVASAMLILFCVFVKLKSVIQASAANICRVFVAIEHRQIVGQIAMLRSFKNYMDFGQTLLDEQSLNQIKQEQNSQIIHKKRIIHCKKYNKQLILMIITLSALLLYAEIVSFNKSFKQNMLINHMNLIHNMYYSTVKINAIWIELNLFPRNYTALNGYREGFFHENRVFQRYLLDGIQNQYIEEHTKQYLVNYTIADICVFQPNPHHCTFNFNGTRKQGVDLLHSIYFRKYQQALSANQSQSDFVASTRAQLIYEMIDKYYSKIDKPVADTIEKEHINITKKQQFANTYYVIVLIFAIISGIVTYHCTAKTIRQINQIQKILHYVQFQVIKSNNKYMQFLIENKVLRR